MKALGLSFGRKMQNSEIMVKQVLKQMEKRGFESRFIRMLDLDIKDCVGCSACVGSLLSGGDGTCILKDDFPILEEALLESDAVVICAPIYVLAPSGLFKTVCDRMGPSHDIAFRKQAKEWAEAAGKPSPVDERAFKNRVCGILTSGGARTKNWTSFGIAQMYEFCSWGINVVDAYNAYAAMDYQHMVGNEKLMARMTAMGDHLADALEKEFDPDAWYGDEEGICPVCHMDMLTVLPGGDQVECPVCGIQGTLRLDEGVIKVDFPPENIAHSRCYFQGRQDHMEEIRDSIQTMKRFDNLQEMLEPYK